ncbi:hypothetical protein RI367_002915 [Sorochytrium milnesiophthora]
MIVVTRSTISPPESIGTRIGTFSFATLLDPPIGDALQSANTLDGYQRLIVFTGALTILGRLGLCVARDAKRLSEGLHLVINDSAQCRLSPEFDLPSLPRTPEKAMTKVDTLKRACWKLHVS